MSTSRERERWKEGVSKACFAAETLTLFGKLFNCVGRRAGVVKRGLKAN